MLSEAQARDKWNDWTVVARRSFIEYHEFNPRFSQYAWQMLPYSVQQLMMRSDEMNALDMPVPHIVGNCIDCGTAYDLTRGMECPRCQCHTISWAYHASSQEEQEDFIADMNDDLPEPLTEFDKLAITELERMWKL